MTKENLEFYLNRHNMFGYNIQKNDDLVSWVILSKRFPLENFFERFIENDLPKEYKEQSEIKNLPYQVWIAELKKEVYEKDIMPQNEDYPLNVNYFFKDLNDVEAFLQSLNLSLSSIKWSSDIEFL